MVCLAVSKPGWPGSEKSKPSRFDTAPEAIMPAMKITPHAAITRLR